MQSSYNETATLGEFQDRMFDVIGSIIESWLEAGAEPRRLRDDEDLYLADYAAAAEEMGRDLNQRERRWLRVSVSEGLHAAATEVE